MEGWTFAIALTDWLLLFTPEKASLLTYTPVHIKQKKQNKNASKVFQSMIDAELSQQRL